LIQHEKVSSPSSTAFIPHFFGQSRSIKLTEEDIENHGLFATLPLPKSPQGILLVSVTGVNGMFSFYLPLFPPLFFHCSFLYLAGLQQTVLVFCLFFYSFQLMNFFVIVYFCPYYLTNSLITLFFFCFPLCGI